tara:strand:+ start:241 stop:390 length:150 start_codon:yes stop_codon:yes gene_type:complete
MIKDFKNLEIYLEKLNIIKNLGEDVEKWTYQKLNETTRVANIINQKIRF